MSSISGVGGEVGRSEVCLTKGSREILGLMSREFFFKSYSQNLVTTFFPVIINR